LRGSKPASHNNTKDQIPPYGLRLRLRSDIFTSFTRQDNACLQGLEHGWIDEYHLQRETPVEAAPSARWPAQLARP